MLSATEEAIESSTVQTSPAHNSGSLNNSSNGPPAREVLSPPLGEPRDGRAIRTLGIARISGGPGQTELSLGDQEALYRKWLSAHVDADAQLTMIAGTGSGEYLDRAEADQAEAELKTGKYDLVLAEDLGRIFRRVQAFLFCEDAEDAGTRLIALNDHVDTGRDDWRLSAFFATLRHEMYNADTAKRIRRTLRNRFQHGGVFQCAIYGYIKNGSSQDADVIKDPAAEQVYDNWFKRLEEGASFAEVADWLNAAGVPTGPHIRKEHWDGIMVGRVTRNPILKGVRVRNNRISKRVNKTGRRKSIKAPPEERLERHCPHLAFIDPEQYDRVLAMVNERNGKYHRKGEDGRDTRANVSKKRTRCPGQMIDCGICGRLYVFGGHGQTDHLMCEGARLHRCWNGATVDGPLATAIIVKTVFDEVEALPNFDETFLTLVTEEGRRSDTARATRVREIDAAISQAHREIANLINFIKGGQYLESVQAELEQIEEKKRSLAGQKHCLEHMSSDGLQIPQMEELKQLARKSLSCLAKDSFEFAAVLRCLLGRIVVFPYRLCDGGKVVLRATFRLQLENLIDGRRIHEALARPLERVITLDLFEAAERAAYRARVVSMRQTINPLTQREYTFAEVGRHLGITDTAAQNAAALHRRMIELAIKDPYLALTEPPQGDSKLQRHKHERFRFEPLPGAGRF